MQHRHYQVRRLAVDLPSDLSDGRVGEEHLGCESTQRYHDAWLDDVEFHAQETKHGCDLRLPRVAVVWRPVLQKISDVTLIASDGRST